MIANTPRQPINSVPQASGVVASRLPSRPTDSTTPARVANRSGGNQREITTMLPISMTPKPAPISARPASSCGQAGATVNSAAPITATASMPVTVRRGP